MSPGEYQFVIVGTHLIAFVAGALLMMVYLGGHKK